MVEAPFHQQALLIDIREVFIRILNKQTPAKIIPTLTTQSR